MLRDEMSRRFADVYEHIHQHCLKANRSTDDITLIAVSKKQPLENIRTHLDIAIEQEITVHLGENYVQEWIEKKTHLAGYASCALIGPLQSNKAKLAVEHFDSIQSVHTVKLARELEKQAHKQSKNINFFLQVNISCDPAKSGFKEDELSAELFEEIGGFTNLKLTGLMAITKFYEKSEDVRPDFRALRQLKERLEREYHLPKLSLSMGMSADYGIAIEEGATHIRVGSSLFGPR